MSKSRPTSFQRSNACRVLPPEHMMTSAHSTTILFISSMVGTVSSSDTSRRFISHPISLNASVCRKNLSVRSKDAVPMYRTLGRSVPASSTTLSTIACICKVSVRPHATIFGNALSSSLHASSSSAAFGNTSSAITKSVSTCSSNASKCKAVAGIGKSFISSIGIGSVHVVGSGPQIVSPVSFRMYTWQVESLFPVTVMAFLPTMTKADKSSIRITLLLLCVVMRSSIFLSSRFSTTIVPAGTTFEGMTLGRAQSTVPSWITSIKPTDCWRSSLQR